MANFKGHALPGSFFLLFGLWWSVKYPLRYLSQKVNKKPHRTYCFRRVDAIEGGIKVIFSLIGKSYISLAMPVFTYPVVVTAQEPRLQRNWSRCERIRDSLRLEKTS